jgi:hypothetical protein
MKKLSGQVLAAAALGAALVGCSDAAGVDGTNENPASSATVTLETAAAAPVAEALLVSLVPGGPGDGRVGARITTDLIESLLLTVEHVEVLPSEGLKQRLRARHQWREANEPQNEGARGFHHCEQHDDWYALEVVGDGQIDLMNLPAEGEGGLVLAAGEIPAGDYTHARLFVTSATITFNTTIDHPNGVVLEQGVPYDVYIPSAEHSGIKTHAGFTVEEGVSEVALVFDPDATVRQAMVRDDGTVMIPPVILAFGRSGT